MSNPIDYISDPDWEEGKTHWDPSERPLAKQVPEDPDHSAVLRDRLRDIRAILLPLPHEITSTTEQIAQRVVEELKTERARALKLQEALESAIALCKST